MSLYRTAQALALVEGRAYCLPEDFKRLVIPAFAHRTVVSSRYTSTLKRGEQAEGILREIVESTPVPLQKCRAGILPAIKRASLRAARGSQQTPWS